MNALFKNRYIFHSIPTKKEESWETQPKHWKRMVCTAEPQNLESSLSEWNEHSPANWMENLKESSWRQWMQCIFLYYVGSTLLDHLVDMFVQHPFSIPQGMFQKLVIKKYIYRIFGNEKKSAARWTRPCWCYA